MFARMHTKLLVPNIQTFRALILLSYRPTSLLRALVANFNYDSFASIFGSIPVRLFLWSTMELLG